MDSQNKNLILATALSFVVILVWFILFPPPEKPVDPNAPAATSEVVSTPATPSTAETAPAQAAATEATADAPRLAIDTPRVEGSVSLLGGRIDQLALKDYRETTDPNSPIVTVLAPVGAENAFYALFGWAAGAGLSPDDVPGPNTLWSVENGTTLTPATPISLMWDNGKGQVFRRTLSIDEDYMFAVQQSVTNNGTGSVALAPYGILARHGEPKNIKKFFILHEGTIAMADGELTETTYSNLEDMDFNAAEGTRADVTKVAETGWVGFTDHYWMSTLIPSNGTPFKSVVKYDERRGIYQAEAVQPTQTVAPGATVVADTQLFSGAKEWETIRGYENAGVAKFIDSIDWGWFFFLTKPIFQLLHFLHGFIGNMGWSIIALTIVLKAIVFPLAYKSYASMAKMKELQPKMEELKKTAGDDRAKLQQAMMELYKKEKVNPASGCLPILIQIPIFFSLYKVIFVTLELRHAPWVGWIRDLSAPDPSSILNLFGLLPFAAPTPDSFLAIISLGILPILLGISMWLQQKLNPAPTDATQAMIFAWMPWVFMFMLGGFASGLVLYWITNNTITFTQQYLIMRSHGYKPDVFGNIKSSFKRKK
ncbi:protein translocase subunit yidC [Thalassovita litoralis]|jgi:YidC/Oxa1 family membrane protein insertase|uniref:Membrane protein insertase YidC n=1 Tax=Thalassovita litoralis TaxID=1010611 RepID=A0A521CQC2_9RHOB|nr:membrane protein insertase YidC [Thalassovita litoralis]SMO61608.1 protein translocase subunit yidC [Thalassovita litoralis]